MTGVLSAAGRAFLRAFVGSMLVLLPGVLAAPNLNEFRGAGIAALIASLTAAFKVLEVFVPQLSVPGKYGPILTSGLQAGVSAFIVFFPGVYSAPDLNGLKAALTALLVGVATAIARALQGGFTQGEFPAPARGMTAAEYR
jgi:hypothetical protein